MKLSIIALLGLGIVVTSTADTLILDDFETPSGVSALGTQWQGFTDRVMGGISDMRVGYVQTDAGGALRMTGSVSLENNGGFIQVRLPLATENRYFDATDYKGIALTVRGVDGAYALHMRTARTRLPWSYYSIALPVADEWRRIEVPFGSFEAQSMIGGRTPDLDRIVSIAVVAGEEEFEADVTIGAIELYR